MAAPPDQPVSSVVTRLRAAGCVFAEEEAELLLGSAESDAELERLIEQRVSGVPLEQILGWAEFCGLRIVLEPGVFVPRHRTTFLVEQAVQAVGERQRESDAEPAVVVDMCCGSGAIGAAVRATLATRAVEVDVHAVDVDPAAVRCARRNLGTVSTVGTERAAGTVGTADAAPGTRPGLTQVYQGDLYGPLPERLRGKVDVLVANAPYVPSEEIALMPPEARLHEPRAALDGGSDGVDVQRRIVADASGWLAPGGRLLIETSSRQARLTADAFARAGLHPHVVTSDELSATVAIGTSPQDAIHA